MKHLLTDRFSFKGMVAVEQFGWWLLIVLGAALVGFVANNLSCNDIPTNMPVIKVECKEVDEFSPGGWRIK